MALTDIRRAELELERQNHFTAIAQAKLRALQIASEADEQDEKVRNAETEIARIDEMLKDGAK